MNIDIYKGSVIGLCGAYFLIPSNASLVVPATEEIAIKEYAREDSWVQPKTTMSYEYTVKDRLKSDLQGIGKDFFIENGRQILSKTLDNAFHVLSKVVDEGLPLPHIAANGNGDVGLTWDSTKHRIYLAIDGFDRLFLSIVNRGKIEDYDYAQRDIGEDNEILSKIRKVL